MDSKARALDAEGKDVISLAIGEPDFDTPENIKLAAIDAIKKGYTKYAPAGGMKELKQAIINKFKRDNNITYAENEICVSSGAKQVIFNALMATLNPGDEVIIIAPFWVSYPEMIKISNGVPVVVENNKGKGFSLDIENIEKSITPKIKWLILNSPNNPSGYVYSYDELRRLANMLLKYDHVHVLSDDIYEHLVYDNKKVYNLVEVEPKLKDRVLIVNGVSKTYAMTGWRIGFGAGSAELIKAMGIVQSQSTSGACSISQMAAVQALNGPQDFVLNSKNIYKKRRDMIHEEFSKIEGLKCDLPDGAFYLFVDCSRIFGKKTPKGIIIKDSNDLANYFIEQVYVAVVAGSAFGLEGFFRVSYATSEENILEGVKRIKEACALLV